MEFTNELEGRRIADVLGMQNNVNVEAVKTWQLFVKNTRGPRRLG